MSSPLLTHSRIQAFRTCNQKHFLAYEVGVRKTVKSKALRMGTAFHRGAELVAKGMEIADAIAQAMLPYEVIPDGVEANTWAVEREKVLRLLHGYLNLYANDGWEVVAAEHGVEIPLLHPSEKAEGFAGQFRLAGKMDRLVKRPLLDEVWLLETKTMSKDLSPSSSYWEKLPIDEQITRYVYYAKRLGYNVVGIIYDCIRKPTMEPIEIPLRDGDGKIIVLDSAGTRIFTKNGEPRQTGSEKEGYVRQVRMETAEEYGDRLSADIAEHPEFYFARREVPRLQEQLDDFEREAWMDAIDLELHQQFQHWPRNTAACLSPWRCEYFDLCKARWTPSDALPNGYEIVADVHPELSPEEEV